MANGIDIKPEGVGPQEAAPADKFEGDLPQHKIAGAENLTVMQRDWVFFTPALLFTHGGLDRDVVQEFVNEAEGTPQLAVMRFDRPLFEGMKFPGGEADWNHRILAIERGRWQDLLKFLGTVGIMDTPRKTFYRTFPFAVQVVDPVQMERAAVLPVPLPVVEVVVFGLDGNQRRVVVQEHPAEALRPARVVILPPDPKVTRYAKSLLAGKDPGEAPDRATVATFRKFGGAPR